MKKTISIALVLVFGMVPHTTYADYAFGTPTHLGSTVNSSSTEWGPSISADGLELYFGSWRSGGFGEEDIYVTTRATTSDPWGEAVNLGPTVNSSSWDQTPSISTNGLTLYFSSDRPGEGLWITTRQTKDDPWCTPVNLGPTVNSQGYNWMPSISADGLDLYFCSDRSGGYGNWDIWVSKRETIHDEWGPPVNLGPTVNSAHRDLSISISHDGLLLFFDSDRPGGSGGHDLWLTRRETTDGPWGTPVNLGPTVNSSYPWDQTPSISADGSTLYFTSERPGDLGGGDIYQTPIIPIVDFNADGFIDLIDLEMLINNWGTDDKLYDIGPMPWGDGIVDAADLEVLMRYWGQPVYDPHFLAHWKLDEIEGDIAYDSITDNDGVVNGEAVWLPEDGQTNGALQCDGTATYVDTPFILNPADGPLSIFAWINGGASGQVIISQSQGMDWLAVDTEQGFLRTNLTSVSRGKLGPPLVSSAVITDGDWHRVGFVWDGTDRILYVDDVEVARDELENLAPSEGGLIIGAGAGLEDGTFFSGLIDDVQIYDRVVEP